MEQNIMDMKKPTTIQEQIEILKLRGCHFSDETAAAEFLARVNYYRFTAYFLPFKTSQGGYTDNLTFSKIMNIYEFDRKLRAMLLAALEEVEITLRIKLAYKHAHEYGSLGYMNPSNFNSKHQHANSMKNIWSDIQQNKHQLFVRHHLNQYEGNFPVWVVIELFSFGQISRFYADLLPKDQKSIASEYFTNFANLESWLKCLTDLRNYCAHYSRLYFYNFPSQPRQPEQIDYILHKKVFDYILILKYLYQNPAKWASDFLRNLVALMEQYENDIEHEHIGFPENWNEILR